eukprot:5998442-Lingulodinium_polyedra.AAC.1
MCSAVHSVRGIADRDRDEPQGLVPLGWRRLLWGMLLGSGDGHPRLLAGRQVRQRPLQGGGRGGGI